MCLRLTCNEIKKKPTGTELVTLDLKLETKLP